MAPSLSLQQPTTTRISIRGNSETYGSKIASAIPMGSVLTLPATGSESNKGAVISRKTTGDKRAFMSSHVQPQFAILDPVYTYTLPPRRSRTAWLTPSSIPSSST